MVMEMAKMAGVRGKVLAEMCERGGGESMKNGGDSDDRCGDSDVELGLKKK